MNAIWKNTVTSIWYVFVIEFDHTSPFLLSFVSRIHLYISCIFLIQMRLETTQPDAKQDILKADIYFNF